MSQEIYNRSPLRKLAPHVGGALPAGKAGAVIGTAGVGKSALLVHVALDAMLRGESVAHVALRDDVDHVRSYYDELFSALAAAARVRDSSQLAVTAERRRMILSYLDRDFDVDHLAANLDMLAEVAHFQPSVLVVDALSGEGCHAAVAALMVLAAERGVRVWLSVRDEDSGAVASCARRLRLRPTDSVVQLSVVEAEGERELPLQFDPITMLVVDGDEPADVAFPPRVVAEDCVFYSGGANGAEAAFGEAAESVGVDEINFTFDGHRQARSRGRYELSPRELAAGDVSLVYVSQRLNRTYSQGTLIRRVLQTIWHMVSRSQQVFVVGVIQDDGTVRGGTGWSVELARMWSKDLWVFDQEQDGWFHWEEERWVAGEPQISSMHFCGTGTRYLGDNGRAAIQALFARSFPD